MNSTKKTPLIIISIKQNKLDTNCVIEFSDNTNLELSMDLIVKYKFKKGDIVSEDLYNSLVDENNLMLCKQTAYKFASYMPRCKAQIIKKLSENNFSKNQIEQSIDFLERYDLVNDLDYSRKYIQSYLLTKRAGPKKLEQELLLKGIEKNIVNEALKQFYPHDKIPEFIELEINKKKHEVLRKDKNKQYMYITNYLFNKGFYLDNLLKEIVKNKLDELNTSEE